LGIKRPRSSVTRVEYTVEFGGEPQDVTVTVSGVADVAGLRRLVAEIGSDDRYGPAMTILYDFTALDMSGLSDRDLERITDAVMERDWTFPPRAIAIVADAGSTFEAARIAIAHLGGSKSGRQLFHAYDDAVAWLSGQRG